MSVREIAFKTIYDVIYKDKYSNILLENNLNFSNVNNKDRSLINNIVMGTLQNYIYLQYNIKSLSNIPYSKISKSVRVILALSIYQIIFLDRIPMFAICDEGVSLTKKYAGIKSKNFANAILRKAEELKTDKEKYIGILTKKEYLSVKYSFNMNIINQLYKKYGYSKLEQMLQGLNEFEKTSIRINTLKITKTNLIEKLEAEHFNVELSPINDCLYIKGNQNPSHSPLYKEGLFTMMDKGAIEIIQALNTNEDDNILDCCASPGGKTSYMSQLMNNKGHIIACDIHESRTKQLEENLKRMGSNNTTCYTKDMTLNHMHFNNKFDKILLDVPCSGIGVSKKRPEIKIKYEYNEKLIETQKNLLQNSSKYIKEKGKIMYATCTILPCENELVIEWFIKNSNFKIVEMKNIFPTKNNMGFFYCIMEKKND